MGRKLSSLVIAFGLIGIFGSPVHAASKEGAKCTVAGKIVTVSGKKLVCAKVNKTLKWRVLTAPTTTTVASTTTVAATTTTTTIAASKVKPVVTLKRSYGTSSGESAAVSYTVTSDKDINCTTLSLTIDVDFSVTRISGINSIVQTTSKICTVNVQSTVPRDNDTREVILAAATTFAISDTDGNVQTTLAGSPQSIWVTRPAP